MTGLNMQHQAEPRRSTAALSYPFFLRHAAVWLSFLLLFSFSCGLLVQAEETDDSTQTSQTATPDVGETFAAPTVTSTGMALAGNTLTLTVHACGEGIYGFEGELIYDPEILSFAGARSLLSGWSIYTGDDRFLFCSDTMQSSFSSQSVENGDELRREAVFTLIFRIAEDAAPGRDFSVTLGGFTQTDGKTPLKPGDPTFTRRIAPPDSTAARLTSLSAGLYELSPAFDPDVFSYEVTGVPNNVESLGLSYVAKSEDLTVTLSDDALHGGRNLLTVTVEAPDGSLAVYSVTVVRAFDDGYDPSSDAALSALTPSRGELTPVFDPDITFYLVVLPKEAEGEIFTLSGVARDEKVGGLDSETAVLAEGTQSVCFTVTAENGSKTVYTVSVLVLPTYDGTMPYVNADCTLSGSIAVKEVTEGYVAEVTPTRADAIYRIFWYADGEVCGEGELLARSESLLGKTLKAVAVGEQGFQGTLSATVYLDASGTVQLYENRGFTVTLYPDLLVALTVLLALAIALGFLVGRIAGRRSTAVSDVPQPVPAQEIPSETEEDDVED